MANFLINTIVIRHGVFKFLVSDRAKCFISNLMKQLADTIGYVHINSTSFHPQANISERVNASIANMLSNYCSTNHKDWDLMLPSITLALNTQYHRSTKHTPFYLMYARDCLLPGDIPIIESQSVSQRRNLWQIACNLAKKYTEQLNICNKSYYDKKRQEMSFKIGDKVMIYSPNKKVKHAKKLLHFWNGPYTVADVKSPIIYEIRLSNNKTDTVHISRMKAYFERRPISGHNYTTATPCVDTNVQVNIPTVSNTNPTHRYRTRLQKRNLNLLNCIILIFLMAYFTSGFEFVDQTIWTESDRKTITDIIPYNFKVDYQTPCDFFKPKGQSDKVLYEWCANLFEESFVTPLSTHCNDHKIIREKRIAPLVIGVGVLIASGVSAGGFYIFRRQSKVEAKLSVFVKQLDQINKLVLEEENADQHIKAALQLVGVELNKTQLIIDAQNNQIRSELAYATYLSFKMAEIKKCIEGSTNEFGFFQLTKEFLDILNATLPCDQECPLNTSSLVNCNINSEKRLLTFGVMARKPSKNIKILRSDSFILYNTTGNQNCHTLYTGPDYLLLDIQTKCLIAIPNSVKTKLISLSHDRLNCSKSSFHSYNWTQTICSIENQFKFLQLKFGQKYNYLYCYYSNITINNRSFECPKFPFKLKKSSNFTINQFKYTNQLIYSQFNLNYNFSDNTNKFLNHVRSDLKLDLDKYYDEINQIRLKDFDVLHENSYLSLWIVMSACITLVLIVISYVIVSIFLVRQRNQRFIDMRQDIAFETANQLVRSITESGHNIINPPIIEEIDN